MVAALRPGGIVQRLDQRVGVVPQVPEQGQRVVGTLVVVVQRRGPAHFVVAQHGAARLGDQLAAADIAVRLAVRDMHDDLVDRPAVGRGAELPHRARETLERGTQLVVGARVGLQLALAIGVHINLLSGFLRRPGHATGAAFRGWWPAGRRAGPALQSGQP